MNLDRLFVSTTFAPDGSDLETVLEACASHGIGRVELGSNHRHVPDPKTVLKRFGLEYLMHNYFPVPRDDFVLNIASLDDGIRTRSIAHMMDAITLCAETGAGLYTFHPGFVTDPKGANRDSSNYDFQFDSQDLARSDYGESFSRMLDSIDSIADHAARKGVAIAVETEGSVRHNTHLLLQRPEEFVRFFTCPGTKGVGISLNLGHVLLAANAFRFSIDAFVDLIADRLVAMEMSHNSGMEDEHKPLAAEGWYWPLISDRRFERSYKILELRNTPVGDICSNLELLRGKLAGGR